ncbi:hypothetical protein H2136_18075 [Aeromonas hydrophila]|uniref:Mor transcription activator domain-containing protein n=1 Tax=Aeromonas hydrophila TaxID=644 RepID=A0A926ITR2_AERHY|nr:hypothetical protein [Aeromonas hydrophila]
MFDTIDAVVEKHRDDKMLPFIMLSEFCRTLAAPFYVPNGKTLATVLRSIQIWNEFTGNNVFELSRKFGVSTREINLCWPVCAALKCAKYRAICSPGWMQWPMAKVVVMVGRIKRQ